jgi:ABC-type uncharacterized transport system permease subunit
MKRPERLIASAALALCLCSPSLVHASPVYWNVFNIEGESSITAAIVTYGSLADMVSDSNRTGTFNVGGGFGQNIVGSGATLSSIVSVPEPTTVSLITLAIAALGLVAFRRKTH